MIFDAKFLYFIFEIEVHKMSGIFNSGLKVSTLNFSVLSTDHALLNIDITVRPWMSTV